MWSNEQTLANLICRKILPVAAADEGGAQPILPPEPGLVGGERDRRRGDRQDEEADAAASAAQAGNVGGRLHVHLLPAGQGEEQLPAPPDQALG